MLLATRRPFESELIAYFDIAEADMMTVKSILFLAYPNFGEQDLLAAWELLRALAWSMSSTGTTLDVSLGSFEGGTVQTHMGGAVATQRTVASTDRFDVLYIPGGIGAGVASKSPVVLDLIRAHHAGGRWVAANCSGVGVLHRAGVLSGIEVAAPATLARRLAALGTQVPSPRPAWKINPEKKIFTAGGAATVHPSTIALVWQLFGPEAARGLAVSWDSLALHGDTLFASQGPAMVDEPKATAALQDQWERVFLPD